MPPFSTFIDSWPSQGTLNSGIFKRPEGDKANSPVPIVFANRSLVIRIVRQIANSGPVECTGRITQPTKCPGATRLYYRSRKGYTLLFRAYVSLSLSLSLSLSHTHTHTPCNHFSLASTSRSLARSAIARFIQPWLYTSWLRYFSIVSICSSENILSC